MKRISFVLLIVILVPKTDAWSYEVKSHKEMTTLAIDKSSISDIDFINNVLGLVLPYNSKKNTFLFEKFPASRVD